MTMKHEVWDVDIGKCFGAFETLTAALAYVRTLLSTNGDDYVQDLVVTTIGDEWGEQNLTGAALLAKASDGGQPASEDGRHPQGPVAAASPHRQTPPVVSSLRKIAAKPRG